MGLRAGGGAGGAGGVSQRAMARALVSWEHLHSGQWRLLPTHHQPLWVVEKAL